MKGNRGRNARERSGWLKPQNARRRGLFSFKLQVALRKCSRSPNAHAFNHKPLPRLRGANTKPRAGTLSRLGFICFEQVAWGLPAAPRPRLTGVRGPAGREAGPASRIGGELSCIAPGRQCPGRAPPGGPPSAAPRHRARSPGPARRACGAPPNGPPSPPPSAPPRGPAEPGSGALPTDRGRQPPAPRPGSSPRGPGRGLRRPRATPPSRAGRLQLTGTWRAAGHYSIAGSALAPRRRRTRPRPGPLGRAIAALGAERRGAAGSGGRGGAGRAARARSARPRRRPGEAREASAARGGGRRAQEGAGDHVPRGGGRSDARLGRSRSAAEGAGFRKSKHFDRKSGS